MPLTVDELKRTAKMRAVCFLDMDRNAYQNTYVSETYPRFAVLKEGGPRVGPPDRSLQRHTTTYFVDDIECENLEAAVRMLNTEPHPNRTDVARHQAGEP